MKTLSKNLTVKKSVIALTASMGVFASQNVVFAQDATNAIALDEIVVTAQRREENIQKVPAAVTALGSLQLETRQILDINDIANSVPNTIIQTGGGTSSASRVWIRGVGDDESRGAVDPGVGIYVDGVYLGRNVGALVDLIDTERVEVLRGPQGTLYGRNTNGGAIKLISVAPQQENSVKLDVGLGNFGRASVRGVANFELGDQTAARLTGLYKERDGFSEINPNGDFADLAGQEVGAEEVLAFRGSLLHNFSDTWSAQVTVDYTDDQSDPIAGSIIPSSDNPNLTTDTDGNLFTIEPAAGTVCSAALPASFQPLGCFTDFDAEVESSGTSLKINGQLGLFDVSSLTSYRTLEDELSSHISFVFFQETDQEQFSQELVLSSNFDGPFNIVGGIYYYSEDVDFDSTFAGFRQDIELETDAFAVFAQGVFDITDDLSFTGGLRYTDETRDFVGQTDFFPDVVLESDIDDVTFTAKLDYEINDNILVYGSYSTGFKSPGFSPDCFSPTACFSAVDQEDLNSFEVGFRSDLANGRLRLNATYFFNEYDDLQLSATVPGVGFTRTNAASAEIQGLEVELTWYPQIEGLEIFTNASWLDAEYVDVTPVQAGILIGNPTRVSCAPGQSDIDCALDLELKNAPEFKISAGFVHKASMFGGVVTYGGDINYESDTFGQLANPPGNEIEPGVRVNARIAYAPDNAPWNIALWSKNLTDEEYSRTGLSPNIGFYAPPRTWGVDFSIKY